jgi:hypothetical protein
MFKGAFRRATPESSEKSTPSFRPLSAQDEQNEMLGIAQEATASA